MLKEILTAILRLSFATLMLLGSAYSSLWQSEVNQIKELQDQAESIGKRNLDSVLLLLIQVESLITSEKREFVIAQNNWVKAKTYYGLKDYDNAIVFGELGMAEAKASENYSVLAKISNLLGVIAKKQGDLSKAGVYYKTSLESRSQYSDSLGMSKVLQNLGILYKDRGLNDSAFYYFQMSINIKVHLDDPLSLAKTVLNLGNYYLETGAYHKAIEQYRSVVPYYEKDNYEEGIGTVHNNIGSAYQFLGYYQLSLSSHIKALEIYRSLGLRQREGNALYNIASLHTRLSDLNVAIDYYAQSLKVYESLNNELGKADVYFGMSGVHISNNEPLKAVENLDKSHEIYKALGREKDLASVQHAYGRAYSKLNEYSKAKTLYKSSITEKKRMEDSDELGNIYNALAVTNYKMGEYMEARSNYTLSLSLAKQFKQPSIVRGSLLGLAETNEALGNSKLAYDYRLQYEIVKDSLNNVEKSRQLAELREIYEAEQKDKQITQLELTNEVVSAKNEANAALVAKERVNKLIFILVALILLILAISLYFYYRQRLALSRLKTKEEKERHNNSINELLVEQQTKSLEAMIQGQEDERIRIAKELHDHFGSQMAAVKMNLVSVASKKDITNDNDSQMKNLTGLVDQACEDIRALSHSMHVGISDTFGLIPALNDLANSISNSGEIDVSFLHSTSTEKIDTVIEITAYRLVQELVSNVLKHSQASKLTIQLTCIDDVLNLIVEDNGIGFDANHLTNNAEGMGLKNMQNRITALHGEFEVDSRHKRGTTVIIDLPISLNEKEAVL